MDTVGRDVEYMVVASASLLLLLTSSEAVTTPTQDWEEQFDDVDLCNLVQNANIAYSDIESLSRTALYSFRLSNVVALLGDELGFWVKPRSTTWFSRFLLDQYDEQRWIKMFCMSKSDVFSLAELLKPYVYKKNTKYRLAIPILVRVACTLFKISSGCSLFICSEFFAVGQSTVSMILRDVVHAINTVLRHEISWPSRQRLLQTEVEFRHLSGLPGVVGAIDGTHISISKPRYAPADYYYFKSGGYTLNCQVVDDSRKRLLDLFLGMSGSTNDSRMLRRSSLFNRVSSNTLWNRNVSFHGFSPYLVGDAGYPLLPWLLVPHRGLAQLPVADALFNAKLRRARTVVENAFSLLKQSFRELLGKSDLHITFLPDVIVACAILHNMLQGQTHEDVERLLSVLREEGWDKAAVDEDAVNVDPPEGPLDGDIAARGNDIRRDLGVHLAVMRQLPR